MSIRVVNSQISDGQLALLPEINVGVAIAVDGGLVVPVVPRTDTLSIEGLSAETTRLAAAARSGGLSLTDLEGGTFSVTTLGMYGVDAFTPVVNPPNTAILGVGRLRDGVRWNGGVAENDHGAHAQPHVGPSRLRRCPGRGVHRRRT